jgi:hypothetical protein
LPVSCSHRAIASPQYSGLNSMAQQRRPVISAAIMVVPHRPAACDEGSAAHALDRLLRAVTGVRLAMRDLPDRGRFAVACQFAVLSLLTAYQQALWRWW